MQSWLIFFQVKNIQIRVGALSYLAHSDKTMRYVLCAMCYVIDF